MNKALTDHIHDTDDEIRETEELISLFLITDLSWNKKIKINKKEREKIGKPEAPHMAKILDG